MNDYYWVLKYPRQAIFYFINELRLNGGLPMDAYQAMNKGDLVRYILKEDGGLEKLAQYINQTSIFQHDKYMQCWEAAFPEDGNICRKVSYGICAYTVKQGIQQAYASNKPVGLTSCGGSAYCSECADSDKASRIHFDGCDYAVSWLLSKLFSIGYQPNNLQELVIYEAGFSVEQGFKPVWYSEALYSPHSLRIFAPFGFKKISEVVQRHDQVLWHEFSL